MVGFTIPRYYCVYPAPKAEEQGEEQGTRIIMRFC